MINALVMQSVREDVEMYAAICGVSVTEVTSPALAQNVIAFRIHARPRPFVDGEVGLRGSFHVSESECGGSPDRARELVQERWTQCITHLWAIAALGLATGATGKKHESQPGQVLPDVPTGAQGQSALPPVHC